MPHQCVRCNKFFDDGAKEILSGCTCGCKMFFFVKKNKVKEQKLEELSKKEKKQIEKDVHDLIGAERDPDKPIILDLESINIVRPGKYEIDLVSLFKKKPLVYRLEEGKYVIDLDDSFKGF